MELIDRQKAISAMERLTIGCPEEYLYCMRIESAQNLLKELPSIEAEPVIYCGECIHMMQDGHCRQFADDHIRPSVSDFCSAGERRYDGSD